ncbi:MAG: type II toxin-antitoxin system RelE/ParE family toxin [Stellaceae bacterium]
MTAAGFSPRARRDLARAMRWIAKDNPSAARALLDAVGQAAIRIGDHPQSGVVRRDLTGGSYGFGLNNFGHRSTNDFRWRV